MTRAIWAGGVALCLAGLLLYGFGTFNPNPLRYAVLSVLAVYLCVLWIYNGAKVTSCKLTWAVIAFVGYSTLSLLWTYDWREGFLSLGELLCFAILFLAALHSDRKVLSGIVPLFCSAAALISILISMKVPGIFGGLGNENFQSEFLAILIPLILIGWAGENAYVKTICAVCGLAAFAQLFFYNGSSAKWAGLAGFGGLVFISLIWTRRYLAAAGLFLLGTAAIAAAVKYRIEIFKSLRERVELSYNTLLMWWDQPILGTGIGSFNYEYPLYQDRHLWIFNTKTVRMISNYAGATHNEYIQALAIFGAAGAVFIGVIFWLAIRSRRTDAVAWGGLAALFICAGTALVGFPLQNPATAVLAVIALALIVNAGAGEISVAPSLRYSAAACAMSITLSLVVLHGLSFRAERDVAQTQFWQSKDPLQAFAAINEARNWMPLSARIRMQLLASLETLRENRPNTNVDPKAADRAYQVAKSASPYHGSVLLSRASYLLSSGRWKDSDEIHQIVAQLKKNNARYYQTWLLLAYYNAYTGKMRDAAESLVNGLQNGAPLPTAQVVARSLNMEISEK